MEISKYDWELYKKKLPIWQEKYMAKLNEEYRVILQKDGSPSEIFWELANKVQKDKRNPGVIIEISREQMLSTIIDLLNQDIIILTDLDDFSDKLNDAITFLCN